MPTISAGSSQTFTAGVKDQLFTLTANGGALGAVTGAATASFGPGAERRSFGPFAVGQAITVTVQAGSVIVEYGDATPEDDGTNTSSLTGAQIAAGATGVAGVTADGSALVTIDSVSREIRGVHRNQIYAAPVIERFGTIGDWTVANSGGTATTSSGDGVIGADCINLQTPALAGQSRSITQDQTIDLSTRAGIWVIIRNRYRTTAVGVGLTTYLAHAVNLGSGLGRWQCTTIPYAGAVSVQPHWIPKSSFTVLDGTPSFSNPVLSWRFRLDSVATNARDLDLCGVVASGRRPAVVITFDDGWDTSYSAGHVEARKREIPLTHYLIGSLLDRTDINYMTTAQAIEMESKGDLLGLHGANRWDEDLTRPASDLAALQSKLPGRSFEHAAYPEGRIGDGETWQTMETTLGAIGVKSGRLAGVTGECTLLGYGDPYTLTAFPLNNTLSLANAQAAVDAAIASGGTAIFYGHKIAAVADALTWTTSDWIALLNYVAAYRDAGTLDCLTMAQWRNQLTDL